jgi:dTMP kinase
VRQEFLQLSLLDPERYFVVDGNQSVEAIHAAIISRVGELPALKRNIKDEEGNRLLKPIRRATKSVTTGVKSGVKIAASHAPKKPHLKKKSPKSATTKAKKAK